MNGFALLWSKILLSSLWVHGSKDTKIVWIALLALKNADGIVQVSVSGLAKISGVSDEECQTVLDVLLSPDKDDTSGVLEGRRLLKIPGGWQVVNNDLYRFSTEERREFWRVTKAEQRAKKDATDKARADARAKKLGYDPIMAKYDKIDKELGRAAADKWLDEHQAQDEKRKNRKPKPPDDAGNGT